MDREKTKELLARWAPDYLTDPIVRNTRVDHAIMEAAAPKQGETALDFATGTGYFALELAKRVAPGQVTGVDISPEMLEVAQRTAQEMGLENVRFQEMPPGGALQSFGTVDLVTSCYALHHSDSPLEVLTRISGVIRPGGRMVIADICGQDDPVRNRALVKLVQAHYEHTLQWTYNRGEVRTLLRKAGFQDIRIGWMPKLTYVGIHLAEVLNAASANPESLKSRAEEVLSKMELQALSDWIAKEHHFQPEEIVGVFIASAVKPPK